MRRVMITGANRGLGLEFVRQLAARGDRVLAGVRRPEQAGELQQLPAQHAGQVTLFALEVTDPQSIEQAFQFVRSQVDGLDLLINNAGIFNKIKSSFGSGTDPKFGELKAENLQAVFDVNAIAPVTIVQRFHPLLKAGREPKVVNISSLLGSLGLKKVGGYYAYSASKAALNMFTRLLALDLAGDGITVACFHPGWVQTEMGGRRAPLAPPESIAGILRVVDRLTPAETGRFWQYTGEEMEW